MQLKILTGQDIYPHLTALAALRIAVFREYPYLYDGDPDYEQDYLRHYAHSPHSRFVLAVDDGQVIGAATAIPLAEADTPFQQPFLDQGMAVSKVFYFGESVLLSAYRGQGIGHRFMALREQCARDLNENPEFSFKECAFCAILRATDDPYRPPDYRPLDDFWRRHGFSPDDRLIVRYRWKQIGDHQETPHELRFWRKFL